MLIKIHPDNPDPRKMALVIDVLKKGGIVIYPTDTVYALGCDLTNSKAIEKLAQIKGLKPEKADFSIICSDLSHLSDYCKPMANPIFKLMKQVLPGPFTFILNANNNIPKIFKNNKKTIGIRVPNHSIPVKLVQLLGHPLVTTSIKDDDEISEYITDPELIYERYQKMVDIVIDGGFGNNEASTIIDCTQESPEIIRQGIGIID